MDELIQTKRQMPPNEIIAYYSRSDVAEAICAAARSREAVGAFASGSYDSRPNVVQYPSDIMQLARKGITSFHISAERWHFPMQLAAATDRNYSQLRSGWDLLIDIDSKIGMEGAKIAAIAICDFLDAHGVSSYGIKFSGSRGFHICVPWESFPQEVDFRPLAVRYPEVPRIIISYMREKLEQELMIRLMKKFTAKELLEKAGDVKELNAFVFIDVEKDWGPRHLFRAPFSLNEKSWLASLPLARQELEIFEPGMAEPEKIRVKMPFFPKEGRTEKLLLKALDWHASFKIEEEKKPAPRAMQAVQKIPEQYFPPCMQNILAGLKDGRKRSVFSLTTFLRSAGWGWDDIEQKLQQWNEKNEKPLQQTYIRTQLNWHKQQQRSINPANCFHEHFYMSIGICQPDDTCKLIKNPMSYPLKKPGAKRRLEQKGKVPYSYSCDMCEKKFGSMRSLRGHRSRVHGTE